MTGETATSREWRTLVVPRSQASSPQSFWSLISFPSHTIQTPEIRSVAEVTQHVRTARVPVVPGAGRAGAGAGPEPTDWSGAGSGCRTPAEPRTRFGGTGVTEARFPSGRGGGGGVRPRADPGPLGSATLAGGRVRRARPPELRAWPLRLGRVRPSSAGLGLTGGRGFPVVCRRSHPGRIPLGPRVGSRGWCGLLWRGVLNT